MGEKTTARWAIPYPTETGEVEDGNIDFEEMANRLDEILHPPGDLRFTAKAALDTGWLKCEGQEVSRATFKALFEAIGTAYGTGNGSSTFNVPDYRERVPVGAASGTPLGTKGGVATVTLSSAQIPSHTHGVSDPGHGHGVHDPGHGHGVSDPGHAHGPVPGTQGFVSWSAFVATGKGFTGGSEQVFVQGTTSTASAGTGVSINGSGTGVSVNGAFTGVSISPAGGGTSHTNLQPYTACNVWIKT